MPYKLHALCVLLMTFSALGHAFDLNITFVDESGKAVNNAVVEIEGRSLESIPHETAVIDQIDRRFVPMVIAIAEGQWVNFPNSDNVRHHVYSFSPIRQFSTELYADEPVDPIQFNRAGIAVLGCNIHDSMVAYVYVSPWQDIAVSNKDGAITLNSLPEQPAFIEVWHPWLEGPDNTHLLDSSDWDSGEHRTVILPVQAPEETFGFRALTD